MEQESTITTKAYNYRLFERLNLALLVFFDTRHHFRLVQVLDF
jgi:hypothetical protein